MSTDVFAGIRAWAPKELLGLLDQVVYFLPEETRLSLARVVESIPPGPDNLTKVFEIVRGQWCDLGGLERLKIVITGPAHTGKVSLLHALTARLDKPEVVALSIEDLPGLDEYLGYRSEGPGGEDPTAADIVLLVLDARYGLTEATVGMYRKLRESHPPVIVVLNRIELAERPLDAVREARRQLKSSVLPKRDDQNIDDLLEAIVAAQPQALYPLSRAFPDFRRGICSSIISQGAFAAAAAGAFRSPFPDFLPAAAIHSAMILKLARAFGLGLDPERVKELLPVVAMDVALSRGVRYLESLHSRRRGFISAAVAGLYTFALGRAAVRYFQGVAETLSAGARLLPGPGNSRFSWKNR